jgi:hypothetical protein
LEIYLLTHIFQLIRLRTANQANAEYDVQSFAWVMLFQSKFAKLIAFCSIVLLPPLSVAILTIASGLSPSFRDLTAAALLFCLGILILTQTRRFQKICEQLPKEADPL